MRLYILIDMVTTEYYYSNGISNADKAAGFAETLAKITGHQYEVTTVEIADHTFRQVKSTLDSAVQAKRLQLLSQSSIVTATSSTRESEQAIKQVKAPLKTEFTAEDVEGLNAEIASQNSLHSQYQALLDISRQAIVSGTATPADFNNEKIALNELETCRTRIKYLTAQLPAVPKDAKELTPPPPKPSIQSPSLGAGTSLASKLKSNQK